MRFPRRTVIISAAVLTLILMGPAYLVWQSLPAPLSMAAVGLQQARTAALDAVGGGQILTSSPTVRGGQPVYAFSIRSKNGSLWAVAVNQGSGQVTQRTARTSPVISGQQAGLIATALIPGGRATQVTLLSHSGASVEQVLVATASSSWRVLVSATTGAVLGVQQVSGQVGVAAAVSVPDATISAQAADAIALQAVGRGQVVTVTKSESSPGHPWVYRVKVLLPTSSTALVQVSQQGKVVAVDHQGDG
ncbi:MAG: PepSY domain-containing protein [Sulfobacillus sp.]